MINSKDLITFNAPLNEVFFSLEGECQDVGTPTLFIRTQGCDILCPNCDTKETWDITKPNLDSVTLEVNDAGYIVYEEKEVRRISITGGNPMLHYDEIHRFCNLLSYTKVKVNIEHPGYLLPEVNENILEKITQEIYALSNEDINKYHSIESLLYSNSNLTITMDIKLFLIKEDNMFDIDANKLNCILYNLYILSLIDKDFLSRVTIKVLVATSSDLRPLHEIYNKLVIPSITRVLDTIPNKFISVWRTEAENDENKKDTVAYEFSPEFLTRTTVICSLYKYNGFRLNYPMHIALRFK